MNSRARSRENTTRIIAEGFSENRTHSKLRLDVESGRNVGLSKVCEDRVIYIGTQPGNSLQLDDDAVSRIHVELRNTEAGIKIRDLGSSNGTWVLGGIRLSEATVPPGTLLQLGQSMVRVTTTDDRVSEPLSPNFGFGGMIGASSAMRAVFSVLNKLAKTDETILITGETGTGKELCAQSIVDESKRANKPFVIVDCGALPPSLLESELFGHARGAFTGAVSDYQGAFERGDGGTVFLDEIGELPLEFQTRLLRAVENRTVRRVGSSKEIPLDIRIIAATNRRLEEEVNAGTFRSDLYYRLSVFQVRLPPLREREGDVELLANHLLKELHPHHTAPLDEETVRQLERYRWPGNVRELRNYLRRMVLGDAAILEAMVEQASEEEPVAIDFSQPFKDAKEQAIARFEQAYLKELLRRAGGNISQAAREARTDRMYFSRLMAKHRLDKKK